MATEKRKIRDPQGRFAMRRMEQQAAVARRLRKLPVRSVLPNVLTVLALCMGLTAIREALQGDFRMAIVYVIIAALLDTLDGRVARLLKGSTRFGAELDSLSDFLSFGVAPALILYQWALYDLRRLGWIASAGFAVCCALRLARFNVMSEEPDRPAWAGQFFVGVPAPAAAGLAIMPLFLSFLGVDRLAELPSFLALYTAFVAFLMVSRVPTFSGKQLGARIDRDRVVPLLIGVALLTVFLINYPWETLTVIGFAYLASIPLSIYRYRAHAIRSKRMASISVGDEVAE